MNPIMNFKVAQLTDIQFSRIKSLENKLNCVIVAYEPVSNPLQLEGEALRKLKDMENELGVTLIAYPPTLNMEDRNFLDENQLKKIKELETQLGDNIVIIPNSKLPMANLSEQQFQEIDDLEKELNLTLVAYAQILPPPKVAQLSGQLRAKFDAFEKEFGCCLVALEPSLKLANLSTDQSKQVHALEEELQDTLFVFESGTGGNQ
ncbi:MAG: hypothetical protein ACM3SY_09960 [Candidatus Omnitrophota bacterium]